MVWQAVAPLVDAWVWQEGQFQFGVPSGNGAKAVRIEQNLGLIAEARSSGADAYIYNNEIAVIDLPAHRVRTFPWQLWRTNFAYPVSRHLGFQGSLSWYTIDGYFGSDPYKYGNVLCGKPLGRSAHPTHPRPTDPLCESERAAGEWFEVYPPSDNDICHKGPVTSIRWELLRQGLEDVECECTAAVLSLPFAACCTESADCVVFSAFLSLTSCCNHRPCNAGPNGGCG